MIQDNSMSFADGLKTGEEIAGTLAPFCWESWGEGAGRSKLIQSPQTFQTAVTPEIWCLVQNSDRGQC